MKTKFILISIVAVLLSFIGGFFLANALNRNEIDKLTAENAGLQKKENPQKNDENQVSLSQEEINAKLSEAEKNPNDFAFQKGLGLALYRYAMMKQDTKLLDEISKLLERAYQINPNDYQVIVSLGNIYYDLGQLKKDSENNLKAREFYKKALDKNDKDPIVLTDYGLTFLLNDSPDRKQAIVHLEKALVTDSKNEKALFYITQAQIEDENVAEANKYLAKLKEVNPKNERIVELEKMISQTN